MVNATPWALPSQPRNLKATIGYGFVRLNWTSPEYDGGVGISGYTVYRGFKASNLNVFENLTSENMLEFNDTSVVNSVEYYYAVAAKNRWGLGILSNVVDSTPGGALMVPLNLSAKGSDGEILVEWDYPIDNGGFEVKAFKIYKGDSESELEFLKEIQNTSFLDTILENGHEYNYSVSAVNARGEGEGAEEIVVIPGRIPNSPILTTTVGNGYVQLDWLLEDDGGFDVLYFLIYKGLNLDNMKLVENTTENAFNDTEIINETWYYYSVSAVNVKGEGPRSYFKAVLWHVNNPPEIVSKPPLNVTIGSK